MSKPSPELLEVTKEMADRVRSGAVKYEDPCVICGEDFTQCSHHHLHTKCIIDIVNENPKLWRDM